MLKKMFCVLLLGVMSASLFTACGMQESNTLADSGAEEEPVSSEEEKIEPIVESMSEDIKNAVKEIETPLSHFRSNEYPEIVGERWYCIGMFNTVTFQTSTITSLEYIDIDIENEKYVWSHNESIYDGHLFSYHSNSMDIYTMYYWGVDFAAFYFDDGKMMLTLLDSSGEMARGDSGYIFIPAPDRTESIKKITGSWTGTYSADIANETLTQITPDIAVVTIDFYSDGTLTETIDGTSCKGKYVFDTENTFSVYVDDIIFSIGTITENGDICMMRTDRDKDKLIESDIFVYAKD